MDLYFGQKIQFEVQSVLMMDFFLINKPFLADGLEWCGSLVDYCDVLSAVWTLILTAPIHCRGSIAEQVMQC